MEVEKVNLGRENLSEPCLAYKSRPGAEKYDSVVNHQRFKMYANSYTFFFKMCYHIRKGENYGRKF